jgi:hypothetical protein
MPALLRKKYNIGNLLQTDGDFEKVMKLKIFPILVIPSFFPSFVSELSQF